MTVEYRDVQNLLEQIRQLPPEYRVQLMHGILETLVPDSSVEQGSILQFGEYEHFNGPMSTYEDYALAEWWPSERDLNGE
jgi:hypothetical protein